MSRLLKQCYCPKPSYTKINVVVPSRCYFRKSRERPLDGVRIIVEDNFDIKGHPTTTNKREWAELHSTARHTAPSLEQLIQLGAIIVGKAKLRALIAQEGTMDYVDYTAPFNSRGDGHQKASQDGNGTCAALGRYDWLDFAIGSNSGLFHM